MVYPRFVGVGLTSKIRSHAKAQRTQRTQSTLSLSGLQSSRLCVEFKIAKFSGLAIGTPQIKKTQQLGLFLLYFGSYKFSLVALCSTIC